MISFGYSYDMLMCLLTRIGVITFNSFNLENYFVEIYEYGKERAAESRVI